jgi:Sulfotransferase family
LAAVVEQLSLAPELDAGPPWFAVERPRSGDRTEGHVLRIAGWVAAGDPAARAVEVVYHGRAIQAAPVGGVRPDVAVTTANRAPARGWEALVGLVGLRPDAELELHLVLDSDERVPAARLGLRREPLRTGFEPQLQPLILTSLGRSGSTWLMKLFAAHPEIVVVRRFPYESSAAKYWMHALKVLSDPADLTRSAHPDTFHSDWWWVGRNPYYDAPAIDDPERAAWLAGTHVERLARFFQESADQWYLAVARSQEQDAPRYFAEKHLWPNFLPMLMRELYPAAREVFLVRDFRDVACSALLADERRGYAGFGKTTEMSAEDYVREVMRRMATDLRRSWEARSAGAHLVRYEDMARDPDATLASLLSYLEVDAAPTTVARLLEVAGQDVPDLPGTSFDPELVARHRGEGALADSIGRWRGRDDGFREVLDDALGDALTAFGYERESNATTPSRLDRG